jgi:flavin-dependent dehydrogenase
MPVRATKRGDERTPLDGDHDVVICGASFAGLAAARELSGTGANVLMVDRYEVGERQTSACAAPTEWLENLGLTNAVRQTFRDLVIHTPLADVPLAPAVDIQHVRLPRAVQPAQGAVARRTVRHREGRVGHARSNAHRPHRPR